MKAMGTVYLVLLIGLSSQTFASAPDKAKGEEEVAPRRESAVTREIKSMLDSLKPTVTTFSNPDLDAFLAALEEEAKAKKSPEQIRADTTTAAQQAVSEYSLRRSQRLQQSDHHALTSEPDVTEDEKKLRRTLSSPAIVKKSSSLNSSDRKIPLNLRSRNSPRVRSMKIQEGKRPSTSQTTSPREESPRTLLTLFKGIALKKNSQKKDEPNREDPLPPHDVE